VLLTLPIRDVATATPRARLVRLDLEGRDFPFTAGQAVVVGARGEKRRPYSLASAPEDARRDRCLELLVNVDAEGRAGGLLPLEPGAPLDVEGPLGTFTFPEHPDERQFLFVAGGTGISPLRSMLRHAILAPQPTAAVGLLYSARTPGEFAFEPEFRAFAAAGALEFRQTITRDAGSEWRGGRGRIDRQVLSELVHGPETLCFVCGPAAMVDDGPRLLAEIGVPPARIRIEEW
jgi:CDP-4-dehydro-6-deoxyglucose reductase